MRKLRYTVLFGALAATGIYLFVYLVRWEWHRALVAGVLFVAAELALTAAAVLDRLHSINEALRKGASTSAAAGPDPLARLRETAPEPRANFEWLSPRGGEMPVFVPLLLGAGVVLSGVAWVVERLARATATPVLERGLAARLVPLTLPVGTLAGAPPPAAVRRRSLVPHAMATAAAVGVVTIGLDAMADATQTRPDPVRHGTTSSVMVTVDPGSARAPLTATRALWGACTTQLGGGFRVLGMTEVAPGAVQVLVSPEIGKYAERRLRGCINDATTDRIRATVQSVTVLPDAGVVDAVGASAAAAP
ncbi:MAG TPA: hypothetical protein VFO65_10265, partial [Acidimicrobiales bacterium]|nr:hypothetical protein [Acidimicrobiales bacterium]